MHCTDECHLSGVLLSVSFSRTLFIMQYHPVLQGIHTGCTSSVLNNPLHAPVAMMKRKVHLSGSDSPADQQLHVEYLNNRRQSTVELSFTLLLCLDMAVVGSSLSGTSTESVCLTSMDDE